jgi:hypothetical protein
LSAKNWILSSLLSNRACPIRHAASRCAYRTSSALIARANLRGPGTCSAPRLARGAHSTTARTVLVRGGRRLGRGRGAGHWGALVERHALLIVAERALLGPGRL